jgi:hypothetical protein
MTLVRLEQQRLLAASMQVESTSQHALPHTVLDAGQSRAPDLPTGDLELLAEQGVLPDQLLRGAEAIEDESQDGTGAASIVGSGHASSGGLSGSGRSESPTCWGGLRRSTLARQPRAGPGGHARISCDSDGDERRSQYGVDSELPGATDVEVVSLPNEISPELTVLHDLAEEALDVIAGLVERPRVANRRGLQTLK